MLRLAICDDDNRDLAKTANLIQEWSRKQNKPEIKLKIFRSPFHLLDDVAGGESFDLFLLDAGNDGDNFRRTALPYARRAFNRLSVLKQGLLSRCVPSVRF